MAPDRTKTYISRVTSPKWVKIIFFMIFCVLGSWHRVQGLIQALIWNFPCQIDFFGCRVAALWHFSSFLPGLGKLHTVV